MLGVDPVTMQPEEFAKFVRSIGFSPDKMLQGRIFSYGDAQRYRLGVKITSLGPVRAKLIKKGMIYSPTHGDMAFTVPLFDEFMRRAIPEFQGRNTVEGFLVTYPKTCEDMKDCGLRFSAIDIEKGRYRCPTCGAETTVPESEE